MDNVQTSCLRLHRPPVAPVILLLPAGGQMRILRRCLHVIFTVAGKTADAISGVLRH